MTVFFLIFSFFASAQDGARGRQPASVPPHVEPDLRKTWRSEAPFNFKDTNRCAKSQARNCIEAKVVPKQYIVRLNDSLGARTDTEAQLARETLSRGHFWMLPDAQYCRVFQCQQATNEYRNAVAAQVKREANCDAKAKPMAKSKCEIREVETVEQIVRAYERKDPSLRKGYLPSELQVQ